MERAVPELSVVMPACNVGEFLDFAITNVVDHQFAAIDADRWELIVVDDGSTDSTLAVAERRRQLNPDSIRVVHTENRGVSAARNLGLQMARGEFVYFIDSDDILLQNSLMPLCLEAARRNADIVKFTFREIDTPAYLSMQANVPPANLTAEDFHDCSASDFICQTNGLAGPPLHHNVWSTIYRRRFLTDNRILFNPALTIGEDLIQTWHTMLANPRVLYADRALYLYHQRSNSAMHVTDPARLTAIGQAYADYLAELLDVERRLVSAGQSSPRVLGGPELMFKIGYNRALCSMILGGASLARIFRTMRRLRALGGDVHPGRPRFERAIRRNIGRRDKLRRWITAYILAPLCHL